MNFNNFFIPTLFAFTSWNAFSSSGLTFNWIQNQGNGDAYCLTPVQGKNEVIMAECSGSEEQNWTFMPSEGGRFHIRNDADKNRCLRTTGGNVRQIAIGECTGSGVIARQWSVTNNADGSFILKNQHNIAIGRKDVLSVDVNNNALKMDPQTNDAVEKWNYLEEFPSPTRPVVGVKKVLLMATYYNGTKPVDHEPIRKAVFGDGDDFSSLQHYLKVASREKLKIEGTFLHNINLGDRPSSCSASTVISRAKEAARQNGVNPSYFDFLFIDISRSPECAWGGLATTPGNQIISNASGHAYWLWSHEFGHNLGITHPKTLRNCPASSITVRINEKCTEGGTADPTDTVGGGGSKLLPVNYQLYAGWLEDEDLPYIKEPGLYNLKPLWHEGGAQGYRIKRSDGTKLILEFRQPQSGFEEWPNNSPFVNGITVRIEKFNGSIIQNTLIDTTPGSAGEMNDAPLMPGKSIYDTLSKKIITLISADATGATIQIENRL